MRVPGNDAIKRFSPRGRRSGNEGTILHTNNPTPLTNALRTYPEVVRGVLPDGRPFVEKRITPPEKALFAHVARTTSCILLPFAMEGDKARYPFLPEGDILGRPLPVWERAVGAIASLAALPLPRDGIPGLRVGKQDGYQDTLTRVIDLARMAGVDLPRKALDFLHTHIPHLPLAQPCLVHDDLIAFNVLTDQGRIYLIDWEHARIDFPEKDIGRFLGDLHWQDPAPDHLYYPATWHDGLIQTYLDARTRLDPAYDRELSTRHIRFAEMWNALGPLERMMEDATGLDTPWFKANLQRLAVLTAI